MINGVAGKVIVYLKRVRVLSAAVVLNTTVTISVSSLEMDAIGR